MAPNLAASKHELIRDMILSKFLTTAQMADIAGCSERSIR
jgi:transcriptional antiterminator